MTPQYKIHSAFGTWLTAIIAVGQMFFPAFVALIEQEGIDTSNLDVHSALLVLGFGIISISKAIQAAAFEGSNNSGDGEGPAA